MKVRSALTVAAVVLATNPAGAAPPLADSCAPQDGMVPVCGFNQPEDLAVLPGGEGLIVSEMNFTMDDLGRMSFKPGQLSIIDVGTTTRRVLYPTPGKLGSESNIWGEPSCRSVGAALSPHGIHLSRRTDGKRQLLVVNHAERVSVEFFEVIGEGENVNLEWRGCVAFPKSIDINDVAALPKGGFVVTVIVFGDDTYLTALKKAERGLNTGFVLRWQPEIGYDLAPGSLAPLPNGIQVSPDGSTAFIAPHTTEGEIWKFDLASGAFLGKATVPGVDNISWAKDGRLLAGTGPHVAPGEPCTRERPMDTCGSIIKVVAINPETMVAETVLERRGAPIGLVSVVVEYEDTYYFGTALGKNVLKIPTRSQ